MNVKLRISNRPDKKYSVFFENPKKTIHFGSKGMSDFTKHDDPTRKERYILRHRKREDWEKSGVRTAGFWSRWLLWNKGTIEASKKDISNRFNLNFV